MLILAHGAAEARPRPTVTTLVSTLPDAAFDAPVLMVGETHRRPRSHALVEALIRRALAADRCVTFALEISADQTALWRRLARTPAAIDRIELSPVHDSPTLRALLVHTARLAQHRCLQLDAIDAVHPERTADPGGRDAYMADRIAALATDDRLVIALVGAYHALRRIDWDYDEPSQSTTYYLERRGIDTYVLLQDWVETEGPVVWRDNSSGAVAALNTLQQYLSAVPATQFTPYADLLIQWPDATPDRP